MPVLWGEVWACETRESRFPPLVSRATAGQRKTSALYLRLEKNSGGMTGSDCLRQMALSRLIFAIFKRHFWWRFSADLFTFQRSQNGTSWGATAYDPN